MPVNDTTALFRAIFMLHYHDDASQLIISVGPFCRHLTGIDPKCMRACASTEGVGLFNDVVAEAKERLVPLAPLIRASSSTASVVATRACVKIPCLPAQ